MNGDCIRGGGDVIVDTFGYDAGCTATPSAAPSSVGFTRPDRPPWLALLQADQIGVSSSSFDTPCAGLVDRVSEHGGVEHQPERAELIFHPLVVALAQLAVLAVADPTSERVAGLLQAQL